jgi:hypothetical protein
VGPASRPVGAPEARSAGNTSRSFREISTKNKVFVVVKYRRKLEARVGIEGDPRVGRLQVIENTIG